MNVKEIIIVGGGTAGWITANLFANKWSQLGINITVIESPNIPIIGVGEGSTPYIKSLFSKLNIPEEVWMKKCNATFKNGIEFEGWSSVKGFEQYFHPFLSELDEVNIPAFEQCTLLRRQGVDIACHPDNFFLMTKLTNDFKLPHSPKHFPFRNAYSYHFDSYLLGELLRDNAKRLGVKHISANIDDININDSGEINALTCDKGHKYQADFFVDCSGFKGLLINKALKVPFIRFKDNLFNDRAVAIPTKLPAKIKPCTKAKALSAGWAWEIPLQNRLGNGYVYASDHITPEEAENELKREIGIDNIIGESKHLKMRVGRVSTPWFKNCLAIGLSQGFIEPLEATALHIVQKSVEEFIEYFEQGDFSTQNQDKYNDKTNYDYECLRDYIVMHYVTNSRNDTQYWQDAREKAVISTSLKAALTTWYKGENLNEYLISQQLTQFYTSASWHAMLAGVGCFPSIKKAKQHNKKIPDTEKIKEFIKRCSVNYSSI